MNTTRIIGGIQIILSIMTGIISFNFIFEANIKNSSASPYNLGALIFLLGITLSLAVLLQGIINIKKNLS